MVSRPISDVIIDRGELFAAIATHAPKTRDSDPGTPVRRSPDHPAHPLGTFLRNGVCMYTAEGIADLTSRLGAATGPKSANQAARRGAEQATRWADWSRERRRAGKSLPAC